MLIVDEKVIFIHVQKAGGTSFCRSLVDRLEEGRVEFYGYTKAGEARSAQSYKSGGLWKHTKAKDARRIMGDRFGKMKKVLLSVRDPIDRVCSMYFYMKRHNERDPNRHPFIKDMAIDDFVQARHFPRESVVNYVVDEAHGLLIDEFVSFDGLDASFQKYLVEFGLDVDSMRHLNANPRKTEYRTLLSEESLTFLYRFFAKEYAFLDFHGLRGGEPFKSVA